MAFYIIVGLLVLLFLGSLGGLIYGLCMGHAFKKAQSPATPEKVQRVRFYTILCGVVFGVVSLFGVGSFLLLYMSIAYM